MSKIRIPSEPVEAYPVNNSMNSNIRDLRSAIATVQGILNDIPPSALMQGGEPLAPHELRIIAASYGSRASGLEQEAKRAEASGE